jgi:HlyD family secretion protein
VFRRRIFWIGVAAALLVLFVAGALLRPKPGKTVQVAVVAKQNLVQEVKAPASVQPRTVVNVSAEIPGKIVQLAVEEGDAVRRGQLLLRLDATHYEAQVRQAEALLAGARARRASAETAWRLAQPDYERRKSLFAQKLLSPGEMEQAERQYEAAQAEHLTAIEEVTRLTAALGSARDQLAKTVYSAPIAGTVIELNVEAGEIVIVGTMNNPGTRILAVGNLDQMVAEAEVDETDIIDLRVGQRARVEVDAIPDTSFAGEVIEIGNSAVTGASASGEKDFEVNVLFLDQVPGLRPGMTADVAIETAKRDSAVAVPIQSIVVRSAEDLKPRGKGKRRGREAEAVAAGGSARDRKKDEKTGVFVVVGDKVEFRELSTGIASETDIEVSGGLQPGDRVVTGPYQVLRDLRPGTKVKVESPGGRGGRRS